MDEEEYHLIRDKYDSFFNQIIKELKNNNHIIKNNCFLIKVYWKEQFYYSINEYEKKLNDYNYKNFNRQKNL